ncbi:MAG TPA: Crp/Fnr family transcriptional regulator [Bdellovibrionota bacterium]|jgi:CRP/FNR family transcriptional regulator|nr:Crp/Fnr family transcriptional regulator [Bdellovibrionota bacterium]
MSFGFKLNDDLLKKFGKKFPPESPLVKEGDRGNTMFLIHSGKVAIVKQTPVGEKILATLKDGDFFGEMALLGLQPTRAATAKTLTQTQVLELNRDAFEAMVKRSPDIALAVIQTLATRLRDANGKVASLIHKDDAVRVFAYLRHEVSEKGTAVPEPHVGKVMPLNLEQMSSDIGVPPPYIEKCLAAARKANMVGRNSANWLWIPHPSYLMPFCDIAKAMGVI